MIIDIKTIYLTIMVVAIMLILAIITIKRLMHTRSKLTSFLMVIEEIISMITLVIIFVLSYSAMEDYSAFVEKYGELKDILTYISIYFVSSQLVILTIVSIYRNVNKHKKFIKDKRNIR